MVVMHVYACAIDTPRLADAVNTFFSNDVMNWVRIGHIYE